MKNNLLFVFAFLFISSNIFAQWTQITFPATGEVNAVHMLSPTNILIGADDGNIYKSTDGGATWSPTNAGAVADFYFFDANKGVAVGEIGTVLTTLDGGGLWTTINTGSGADFEAVHFADASTGFAVGRNGAIIKTTDGGQTWVALNSGTIERLEDVWFLDTQKGFVAGREGVMLKTTDGGITWTSMSLGGGDNSAIYFINNTTGFIAGENGLYRTTDGGNNWTPITTAVRIEFGDITFVDNNIGYAVEDLGFIAKTTDGGLTWTEDTTLTANELSAISFADASNGFAVGDFGTVLKYSTTVNTGAVNLNDINFEIYPNPVTDRIIISGVTETNAMATFFDMAGRLVAEVRLNGEYTSIDVSNFDKGVYLVKINVDTQFFIHKFVIE